MSYIYIINNNDWNYESKYKYGYTENPITRIINSHEQHSYQSYYIKLYKIEKTDKYKINYKEYDKIISFIGRDQNIIKNIEEYYDIKLAYLRSINKFLVNNNGSTEFIYKSGVDILHNLLLNEYPLLGLNVSIVKIEDINIQITKKLDKKKYEILLNPFNHKKIINIREYQQKIITGCVDILYKNNKVYLELATGGGKSYIVYNILNIIKPKIIIIFSPLDIIKSQNISNKYITILDNKYKIFSNCPNKKIDENIIITLCTQSYKNIYDYIIKYNIEDICIWFDESHWAFEEWSKYEDDIKEFFLENTNNISKRIFTSASPDKELVLKNKRIFGELYNPIKVCELIKDKWLCSINPYVFSMNKNDPDIINYNLEGFKDKNKKFGFSFHSNCNNAYNLFIKHYGKYKKNKTDIKPFLLLGDNFTEDYDIILDYDYKDVKIFETTPNSIAYVVKRFSIGYDFDKIDILFISDPKTAYKDIIQTIGRGMRPDKLGENGTNLYKILDVYLPVYIEEESNNEYKNIIEVLRYLIYDIGLEYKNINFHNNIQKENDCNENLNDKDKYIGNEEVKGILLELLKIGNKKIWNCKSLTEHLCKNNIHNQKDYNEYYKNNPELAIPENIFIEYPDFIWYDTYKKDECPYYSKIDCIDIIKQLDNDDLYMYDDEEKLKYFNNIDNKIPTECLWGFYGGNRCNYFN
jgi:superfamily II DNA or RNA helicase